MIPLCRTLAKFAWATGAWAPACVLILHKFLSIRGYQNQIDWWNHYSGGLAFSFFVWKSFPIFGRWLGTVTPIGKIAITFLAGCSAALCWDIVEFLSDLILGTDIQKSISETMMDLLNGFLGCSTTTVILCFLLFRARARLARQNAATVTREELKRAVIRR